MVDTKKWHPQARAYKSPPYTVEVPGLKKVDGETIPRRNLAAKDGLVLIPEEGVTTLWDIVRRGATKFGNAKAVGYRKLIHVHNETKKIKKVVDGKTEEVDKKWTYFEMSGYNYISFIEYERMAQQVGAGLRKLGMKSGDRLEIFASTSPFWLAMAHGAASQNIPIVTAYDTLGEEGLKHSMKQSGVRAIFLDPSLLPKLKGPLKELEKLEFIVYNSELEVKQEHIDALKKEFPKITIQSFNELKSLGESNPVELTLPSPDDLCCIMYTSGSTGPPKGVLLKHRNVIAAVAGVNTIVGPYLGPGDGLLTYLPLAHILEFVFENAVLYWGGTAGYGSPKTLTDASMKNCKGDIREFRPTILVGVPAVFESVKKGILAKVNSSNILVRNAFWTAMHAKSLLLATGLPGASFWDTTVLSKVKDATGGRLRICLNGGGPLAKDTLSMISVAIAPIISGYGLTETTAMGALTDPASWTNEALGEIPSSIEMKLVDFPDAGYFSTNKPPQGEIWIRGGGVATGYLDLPKENEESFHDGWFKTGDIGEFDHKGQIKIIDRKKNLVKTQNGEYIALEKLESIYRSADIVANICVYAAQDKQKPVAIIVPAEAALKKLAKSSGCEDGDLSSMVHDKKLNRAVLKNLQDVGRQGGLSGIEIIEGVAMADEEWTPQNGLVTSAQKLQRRAILDKYKKEVDAAYSSS